MVTSGDDPQRLEALNALVAIASGRKGDAANRLEHLARGDNADPSIGIAALESGLWLALDDNPSASYEPLQRALEGKYS